MVIIIIIIIVIIMVMVMVMVIIIIIRLLRAEQRQELKTAKRAGLLAPSSQTIKELT